MLYGTHLGSFRGLPPTGRQFEMRFLAIFDLRGRDDLVCERVYFDSATVLRQLGIAHDPLTLRGRVATVLNHPLTVGGPCSGDPAAMTPRCGGRSLPAGAPAAAALWTRRRNRPTRAAAASRSRRRSIGRAPSSSTSPAPSRSSSASTCRATATSAPPWSCRCRGSPRLPRSTSGDPLAYLDSATQPPPRSARPPVARRGRRGRAAGRGDRARGHRRLRRHQAGLERSRGARHLARPTTATRCPTAPSRSSRLTSPRAGSFVAIRLAPRSDGRLKPLDVSLRDRHPRLSDAPLAAVDQPIDLTLYTLADGPRQVEGLDTVWQGPVTALSTPAAAGARRRLRRGQLRHPDAR